MIRSAMFGATLIALGASAGGAQAFVGGSAVPSLGATAATPVAMCGYTCRSGGRYIPGPPEVCARRGLEYCGSSRGGGGGARVVVPGVDVRIGGGERRRDCKTVTIERDDGTVVRRRRCD